MQVTTPRYLGNTEASTCYPHIQDTPADSQSISLLDGRLSTTLCTHGATDLTAVEAAVAHPMHAYSTTLPKVGTTSNSPLHRAAAEKKLKRNFISPSATTWRRCRCSEIDQGASDLTSPACTCTLCMPRRRGTVYYSDIVGFWP